MLDANAKLTLRAVVGAEIVKSTTLTGDAAYLQLTYEHGKTRDARHDFLLGDEAIGVTPEKDSVLREWTDLASVSELRIGEPGQAMNLTFYSVNDENADLTLDDHPVREAGPVIVRGRAIVRAGTGETVAERTAEDYWRFDGKLFSDVCISALQEPEAAQAPAAPAVLSVSPERLAQLLEIERKWLAAAAKEEQLSLVAKIATVKSTGETVYIRHANGEGGVHVTFVGSGSMLGKRAWFRIDDLENFRAG